MLRLRHGTRIIKPLFETMPTEPNPYQSPGDEDSRRPDPPVPFFAFRATRWRVAPALLFGVLGAVAVAAGLLMLLLLCVVVVRALPDPESRSLLARNSEFLLENLVRVSLIIGWGVLWLVAARWFWRGRWMLAVVSVAVGLALLFTFNTMPP